MPVLSARNLAKAYGPQTLLANVSLTVRTGEKVGLLGINGAGKSTLLRVLAGLEPTDEGVIDRRRDARVLYLPQEPELDGSATPRAIVEQGLAEWHAAVARHAEVTRALEAGGGRDAALVTEQAHLAEAIDRLGGWTRGHVVEDILAKLGVRELDRAVGSMSGGERRRVALARLLVAQPTLAILDEPTNHLDTETIEWLERYLVDELEGAVLLVTHDRYVLDAICDRIFELDAGVLTEFEGNYSDYVEQKAEMLAHAERAEANRMNFVRREQAWLRRGAKARSTKQKARIQRAEAVIGMEAPREQARVTLDASATRMGKTILELRDVGLDLGGRTLVDGLTLHMVAGDRIGIVGRNGTGKTSLLEIVSGELAPTRGQAVRGVQTKIAYFDQSRAELIDDWTVFDNVAEREGAERTGAGAVELGGRTMEMRTYLEQFLFEVSKQRQKVGSLSGGERARVALAKLLKGGSNLLLLDEPTNDLDVATLSALEEMLETWPGCALVVSHDRYFLNRVATSILAFEEGGVVRYPGNYDTYRALKLQSEADALSAASSTDAGSRNPSATAKASNAPNVAAGSRTERANANADANETTGSKPLTFAERLELDGLLDKVTAAESIAGALEARLADPALYSGSGVASAVRAEDARALTIELAAARAEVARLTARWEELESRPRGLARGAGGAGA